MQLPFIESLLAPGPHSSLGEHAATYGRFIGSWSGEAFDHEPSGTLVSAVRIHFAWVLQGRAVQDLWITEGPSSERYRYGTTLRVFDPARALWRVSWINPVTGARSELIGRRQGDDVVQVGALDHQPIRWTFREVTPESFLWQGHMLEADGSTWRLDTEFRVRRTG